MSLKNVFYICFSITGLVTTFYSAAKFMIFISEPRIYKNVVEESVVPKRLFIDILLLSAFVLQHSFMALPNVKQMMSSWGLDVLCRSIYNLITSILLMVLIKYWQTVSDVVLWNIDVSGFVTWCTFVGIHALAWSIIYTGCLLMDISELLGVKQVYYSLRKMPDPIKFKSSELQRLYGHTRHPSFSTFIVIFWCYPTMSLDRLLMASILTIYMFLAWRTDKYDLNYQHTQYIKKSEELMHMH